MSLSLVAAVAENQCIGKNGTLPWHIPEDMKHFKELTSGHVVLMGRKTWESIPEKFRPLPHRINIVITRQEAYAVPEGVFVFPTIEEALAAFPGKDMMVIGGAQMYAETIGRADTLYITHVHSVVPGDTFFPSIDPTIWRETDRKDHDGFSFVTYKRI
ncbi:MAG TPA: dihydrofolate reductase [Candidatus Kapabacteria bacterium]|nr:dihydrofolate reductase [Candidatus Kapabacteria bacterium]